MTRWLREFRLIPVVLIAAGCLFVLKAVGLMLDGGYTLGQRLARGDTLVVMTVPVAASKTLESQATTLEFASTQPVRQSWMQEMFNYPDVTGSIARGQQRDTVTVTGSTDPPKPKEAAAKEPPAKAAAPAVQAPETRAPAGRSVPLDQNRHTSAAERAILERLHERRQELDARARELDIRESMLKAAEKKLEAQKAELKTTETRVGSAVQKKEEGELARLKGIVTMYETMKPKEAAKIFDRLDIRILMDVASQISPRRMSEIMAQMSPDSAERLTVELAARASGAERTPNPAELPKIEGRPGG